jgi:hypothetical protein
MVRILKIVKYHSNFYWRLLTSFRRSKRVQSQNKKLRKKEKSLIKQAYSKETRLTRTDYQDEAGHGGTGHNPIAVSSESDQHFFFNPQNRLMLLHHLCGSEDVQLGDGEMDLLVQLVRQQPNLQRRIEDVLAVRRSSLRDDWDAPLDLSGHGQPHRIFEHDFESAMHTSLDEFRGTDQTRVELTPLPDIPVDITSIEEPDQFEARDERPSRRSKFSCIYAG